MSDTEEVAATEEVAEMSVLDALREVLEKAMIHACMRYWVRNSTC